MALDEAAEAGAHFCETPGRRHAAKSWLQRNGFSPQVVELLDSMLDRLPEIRDDQTVLHDLCLPRRAENQLVEAAKNGELDPLLGRPSLPPGYERRRSKTTGLYLLEPQGGGNPHFYWSDALKTALPAHHGAEDLDLPHPLLEADAKVEGSHPHPYLVTAGLGNWCRLCQETAGENHAASEKHCALKSLWHRCVAVLRSMCEWCHLIPTEVENDEQVLAAWRAEILLEMQDLQGRSDPEDELQVLSLFWHLVRKQWPSKWPDMLGALKSLLSAVAVEEPDLVSHMAPPELGEDLPCFPPIRHPLNKESTVADLSKFTVLELLARGLELQESGVFRCWYCEVDVSVEKLPDHILPCRQKKKGNHDSMQQQWDAHASFIKANGWTLQGLCEVRGRQVFCGCCPDREISQGIEEHLGTGNHQNFAKHLPKPSAHVEERRRMIWMAAVEAAETKQMKMACQRQEALAKSLDLKLVSTSDEEPTVADRQKAQAAADGRGCPKLPAPLCWGYKGTKKKEIYVWCCECKTYCGWVLFNMQHGHNQTGNCGQCTHWANAAYAEKMTSELKAARWNQ